jgi:hypothetical protein
MGLCEYPVVDRHLDYEVFLPDIAGRRKLVLLRASHLGRIATHFDAVKWELFNLTTPGFRINEDSVAGLTSKIEAAKSDDLLFESVVIVQLYDNSVYQVRGPSRVCATCRQPTTLASSMWRVACWLLIRLAYETLLLSCTLYCTA